MDIILHYEQGRGWMPSFKVSGFTYTGEYKLTAQEALAAALKAFAIAGGLP